MMEWKAMGAGCALALVASVAWAHSGAKGVVKERMTAMKDMAGTMKAMAPMMRGQAPYDAAAVRDGAARIAAHGGDAMTRLFPEGSGHAPSEVKPEVWQDWQAFSELAAELEARATALGLAAGNGLGAGTPSGPLAEQPANEVFVQVGRSCSACHSRFRIETD